MAISAVYITLDRLEVKGLVRSRIGDPTPQRGGRRRKHFVILPAGRRAVLYAVRRRGEATAEQVAEQLDITVSGARQYLAALVDGGLLTSTTQADAAVR